MSYYVYSTQFLAFAADETPSPFVVPPGYIAVIRDISITSGGGAIIHFKAGIADVATIFWGAFTIESVGQTALWRGRTVVNQDQSIYVSADGPVDGAVSGYLLIASGF